MYKPWALPREIIIFLNAVSEIHFLPWVNECCHHIIVSNYYQADPGIAPGQMRFIRGHDSCHIHVRSMLCVRELAASVACRSAEALIGGELWAWHSWMHTGCGVGFHGAHSICGWCYGRRACGWKWMCFAWHSNRVHARFHFGSPLCCSLLAQVVINMQLMSGDPCFKTWALHSPYILTFGSVCFYTRFVYPEE